LNLFDKQTPFWQCGNAASNVFKNPPPCTCAPKAAEVKLNLL